MSADCGGQVVLRRPETLQDYAACMARMRSFTDHRTVDTPDELWLLQHHPVFTQGQAGKAEHIIDAGDIPVVQSDRGGQVTYHGPGQVVAYVLIDIRRRGLNVRELVCGIEQSVIDLLGEYEIDAYRREGAPGVYVGESKIAALGLRIRKGCSYHGLSLNVDMHLTPFSRINPCGFEGLKVTQLRDLGVADDIDRIETHLASILARQFGYHYIFDSKSLD